MSRYFLEVAYLGTAYAGFQIQENALTVQEEVERALTVLLRTKLVLTGSSRTDTGVHAMQNYFHFDCTQDVEEKVLYNLNSILPPDIAVKSLRRMPAEAHCRFDAISRQYIYSVYRRKDPFYRDRAYYYPLKTDFALLQESAAVVKEYSDFASFAKRNAQVKTYTCTVFVSEWEMDGGVFRYRVRANRFLRGMVRGLVGTMLQVGRHKLTVEMFRKIIESGDSSKADFSVPGHGLCLEEVAYPADYFG